MLKIRNLIRWVLGITNDYIVEEKPFGFYLIYSSTTEQNVTAAILQ